MPTSAALRWPAGCNAIDACRSVQATRGRSPRTHGRTDSQEDQMPAKTEKQRKFMGAELERKREGKKTQTNMSEKELEKMASKPSKKK
jgi:hypothetical protein